MQKAPSHLSHAASSWEDAHLWPAEVDYRYVEGFKLAAEVLVDHVYETGDFSYKGDSLFYPVAYLLRHHLELKIKHVLRMLGHDAAGHILDTLWNKLSEVAGKKVRYEYKERELDLYRSYLDFREYEDLIGFKEATEIVRELHALDPTGQGFRYAKTLDGAASLPAHFSHANLKRWLGRILSVGSLLDGIEAAIDAENEARAEARYYAAEAADYYSG